MVTLQNLPRRSAQRRSAHVRQMSAPLEEGGRRSRAFSGPGRRARRAPDVTPEASAAAVAAAAAALAHRCYAGKVRQLVLFAASSHYQLCFDIIVDGLIDSCCLLLLLLLC